jgi:hypothetical protein
VDVGSGVAGGLAVADDGGTVAVAVGVTDGLAVDGLAVGVGEAVLLVGDAVVVLAVAVGAAELLVGDGAGGPKQPVSPNRALTARTLNAESLGLVMMPPWVRSPPVRDLPSKYARAAGRNRDLSPPSAATAGSAAGSANRQFLSRR